MSRKHKNDGKCRLCGGKAEKGKTLCKSCEAWEKAGNMPVSPGELR